MDQAAVRERLSEYFARQREVIAAYLFGSVARGTAGPGSDVDVGIVLTAGSPKDLEAIGVVAQMQDELESELRCEVDLVVLNEAAPDLLHRILRDGIVIHEQDHRHRIEFEVRARNDYFDMRPIIERYRRTVLGGL